MTEAEDDELGGTNHRHADLHDHPAFEDIERSHCFTETDPDKKGFFRFGSLKRPGPPLQDQEIFDHGPDLDPGVGVVGFKDKRLRGLLDAFFHHVIEAADANVAPFVVVTGERARPPDQNPLAREHTDGVDRLAACRHVHVFLVLVINLDGGFLNVVERHIGRCLPYPAGVVDHGVDAGNSRRGRRDDLEFGELFLYHRVDRALGMVEGGLGVHRREHVGSGWREFSEHGVVGDVRVGDVGPPEDGDGGFIDIIVAGLSAARDNRPYRS